MATTADKCEPQKPRAMTITLDGLSAMFDVPKEIDGAIINRVRVELTVLDGGKFPFAAVSYVIPLPDDDEKIIDGGTVKMLMP